MTAELVEVLLCNSLNCIMGTSHHLTKRTLNILKITTVTIQFKAKMLELIPDW